MKAVKNFSFSRANTGTVTAIILTIHEIDHEEDSGTKNYKEIPTATLTLSNITEQTVELSKQIQSIKSDIPPELWSRGSGSFTATKLENWIF